MWVALFGGSAVRHYTADGRLAEVVDLPVTQQTVTYTYHRGTKVESSGTGWVERIVVDHPEVASYFTPLAICLNLDSFDYLQFDTTSEQLLVYTLVIGNERVVLEFAASGAPRLGTDPDSAADDGHGGRPLPPVEIAENTRPSPPVVTRPADPAPARPRPRPVQPAPAPAVAAPARDGGWRVQLGAFGDAGNARKLWAQVGGRFPGRQPYFVKAGALTKLLVGPYASRAVAASACGSVKPCVPVAR
mgnify:CR=1 FL=1